MARVEFASDTDQIADPSTYVHGVPYDAFARLRRTAPTVWIDEPARGPMPAGTGFWAVLRHGEARRVLRSPQVFSSSLGLTQIFDAPPPLRAYMRKMLINMDPPEHSRVRALVARAFTPRAVARLEHGIRLQADALVEAMLEKGECDFVPDVAAELALVTLAEILGVPEPDRWLMFDWSNRVIGFLDPEHSVSNSFQAEQSTDMARRALEVRPLPDANGRMPDPRHPSGMADLYAYARELAIYKRSHPSDDMMSALMQHVDEDSGRVSVDEFENLFWLFSIAGNETVRNALAGGMLAFAQHPDQLLRLRGEPGLLHTAVEEMLRWWTPVVHFRRTASEDADIGGVPVRAGDKVVVFFTSANRDESVFADPGRFDVGRTPNDHIAFGHGPHFCIAAHLAREQMRALFGAFAARVAQVELAADPVRLQSNFQNGIKHLRIRCTAA